MIICEAVSAADSRVELPLSEHVKVTPPFRYPCWFSPSFLDVRAPTLVYCQSKAARKYLCSKNCLLGFHTIVVQLLKVNRKCHNSMHVCCSSGKKYPLNMLIYFN
ncbi:hypothetical protein CEXT_635041 [Caerostris extrusa]|uniref:Uncharacterized protein n=1 Tax=Caerostris extrusa TaxID=172846 RepID=A0AAV4UNN9_CAEEX|nr:hypothetical protein CEXT_635041 [Caerostris extrusa]